MKIYFTILFISFIQLIVSFDSKDFVIEEVKRNINLKKSIISIENQLKLKKTSFEDTFRYLVPKNNTFSLVRIAAETNNKKKLEIQKVSDDQD